jgi:hypothetical protein
VVNVVSIPAISDAFKVQETLFLMMRGMQKETIKYSIFFPVASTTPSKGKAEGVDKTKQDMYNNYATGFGNYRTLNAELFVNQELIMIM